MTRMTVQRKEEAKPMNPVWRGIGCLLVIGIFVGSFALSTWFIDKMITIDRSTLPQKLQFLPGALKAKTFEFKTQFPWFGGIGKYTLPLIFSIIVSILMFALVSLGYGIVRGPGTDPRDVRKWEPPGRKKRKVRRCR